MYAFLYPQIAKKFIYEHAIVMQSFFRQNWLVIIFMMLVKQLLSNQSTRIKQNSAMSRQIKFYIIRNEPIETFLSCRPPFYGGWCISLSWTYNTTWNTNFAKSCYSLFFISFLNKNVRHLFRLIVKYNSQNILASVWT